MIYYNSVLIKYNPIKTKGSLRIPPFEFPFIGSLWKTIPQHSIFDMSVSSSYYILIRVKLALGYIITKEKGCKPRLFLFIKKREKILLRKQPF